jgi:hypothetical protein
MAGSRNDIFSTRRQLFATSSLYINGLSVQGFGLQEFAAPGVYRPFAIGLPPLTYRGTCRETLTRRWPNQGADSTAIIAMYLLLSIIF